MMKRIIDKCKQIIGKQLFENKKEDIQFVKEMIDRMSNNND